ncbi:hypothetical protein NKG05_10480 [Oerskovia sp. M15]
MGGSWVGGWVSLVPDGVAHLGQFCSPARSSPRHPRTASRGAGHR